MMEITIFRAIILGAVQGLKKVKKDCIIIDIASNPGGVDRNSAKELGIKMIWALSLPGRVAPITSAEFIKETLENIIKDLKNN